MSDGTGIEWTDATWNPIRARSLKTGKIGWHCEHVTTGCEHCYAEGINKRLGTGLPFKPGHRADVEIYLDEKILTLPLRWKRPRKIFVGSMTDLFASFVTDEMLDRIFAVMALTPWHTFQLLTKRAERMRDYCKTLGRHNSVDQVSRAMCEFSESGVISGKCEGWYSAGRGGWYFENVWLGVSCERQEEADERIPLLLQTPAAVRFISAEPLLGPIKIWHFDDDAQALRGCGVIRSGGMTPSTPHNLPEGYDDSYPGLDWVIVGGESGPNARPFDLGWAGWLIAQCEATETPLFIKQFGSRPIFEGRPYGSKHSKGGDWNEWPDVFCIRDFPQQPSAALGDRSAHQQPNTPP